MKLTSLYLSLSLFLVLSSCHKDEPCATCPPSSSGLDTTSHNFTWNIDTIGVFQSSLSDVWGSWANNVYAVGRIGRTDSVDYNVTHFDGSRWNPFYILFGTVGAVGPPQLFGVFGFSQNNVWAVGVGAIITHWDGTSWRTVSLGSCNNPDCLGITGGEQLAAIWGTSSQDLFAVGDGGVIVHYNGQVWTKMQSGTQLFLKDVWGSSSTDVWATGMDFFSAQWTVPHYDGLTWQPSHIDSITYNRPGGVWGTSKDNVYIASDYVLRFDGQRWNRLTTPNTLYNTGGVEGSAANNLFVVGSFGVVLHWNGSTWRQYDELLVPQGGRLLERVWTDGKEVFVVGSTASQAIVVHGKL